MPDEQDIQQQNDSARLQQQMNELAQAIGELRREMERRNVVQSDASTFNQLLGGSDPALLTAIERNTGVLVEIRDTTQEIRDHLIEQEE